MGKKKNKVLRKEKEAEATLSMIFWSPPPEKHPSVDQEDPINNKRAKTIEVTPWGIDWTRS